MIHNGFLYRQLQRWKYYTSKSDIGRLVAHINRFEQKVWVKADCLQIPSLDVTLSVAKHGFVLRRFDLFLKIGKYGKFSIDDGSLIFTLNNFRLRITTDEELFIIREIFIDYLYLLNVPEEEYLIIDVGMNVGFASLFFAADSKVKQVHSFEPFKMTYDDALFNLTLNPHLSSKIFTYNVGLGKSDTEVEVTHSLETKGKNSIYDNVIGSGRQKIKVINAANRIDSIAEQALCSVYLKMDCEGAEFDIFDAISERPIHHNIKGVIMEWHQRWPHPIIDVLRKNNFRMHLRGNDSIGILTALRS